MITATVCPLWNCFVYDYPIKACLDSLAAFCDRILIDHLGSFDGTKEFLYGYGGLEITEHKDAGISNSTFVCHIREESRKKITEGLHVTLDADEVFHEIDITALKTMSQGDLPTLAPKFLNFLTPSLFVSCEDVYQSSDPVRIAPFSTPFIEDGGSLQQGNESHTEVKIFHYGMARWKDPFRAKCIQIQDLHLGCHDPRLVSLQELEEEWRKPLMRKAAVFSSPHPRYIRDWLKSHYV